MNITALYYLVRPLIPRRLQLMVRREIVRRKRYAYASVWPIDERAKKVPARWEGWPERKRFALVLTHDVDTVRGHEKSMDLMRLEEEAGFRSSFNFVPRRYKVDPLLRRYMAERGFEVGVHGLYHDGKYYSSRKTFRERAALINRYLEEWGAAGFRSPSMHHNLEWIHDLNIMYDASTFDTDPFEPQADGVGTVFPFWVSGNSEQKGYVELPYTLPQDFTLFVLLKERDIGIWRKKLDWVAACGGMALLNTHPDYMSFTGGKRKIEEYPAEYYREFLEYVTLRYDGQFWHVLPGYMARFWADNVVGR